MNTRWLPRYVSVSTLPPPRFSISGAHRARQADERIGADVERDAEALARRLDERIAERVAPARTRHHGRRSRGRRTPDRASRPARQSADRSTRRTAARAGSPAWRPARGRFPRAARSDRSARGVRRRGRRLRDRPGNRALVGDTDDQAVFSREISHGHVTSDRLRPWAVRGGRAARRAPPFWARARRAAGPPQVTVRAIALELLAAARGRGRKRLGRPRAGGS